MACKYLYNNVWYTEDEIEILYNQLSSGLVVEESLPYSFNIKKENDEVTIDAIYDQKVLGGMLLQISNNGKDINVRNVRVEENERNKKVGYNIYKQAIRYATENNLKLRPDFLSAPESVSIYKNLEKEGLFKINSISEQLEDGRYALNGESTGALASDNLLFQKEEMPASRASGELIQKMKEVAAKMGITIENLVAYAKRTGLPTRSVNGLADMIRGIVAIAEGKEDVALTEEVVHIATAMIEQTNPELVTQMISKIDRFKIYNETLKFYRNDKNYQLPNGKPDIRKIKKEAVDKLIAEVIVNGGQNTLQYPELMEEENMSIVRVWWNRILDFIRGIYRKANIDVFEEVASMIAEGDVGITFEDGLLEQEVYFQKITDPQKRTVDKLMITKNTIDKRTDEQGKADPMLLDSEEADNFYVEKKPDGTWARIKKRVTDRVKAWYKEKFPGKVFTPEEKAFNEEKRKYGILGHLDYQEIHGRYFNEDGTRRAKPGPRPKKFNLPSQEMYDKLEKYYVDLIDSLGKDTLVFSEVIIYDPKEKEAGTIDFLAIDKNGKVNVLDWKFMFLKKGSKDIPAFKQGAFDIQLRRYKEILRDYYGVKEFGMIRAIPTLMKFEPLDPKNVNKGWKFTGIVVGSVNPDKIEDIRLLPISEQTETTGYEALDEIIGKLNKLLAMIGRKKVTEEEERDLKYERQRVLRNAIRVAQTQIDIAPLIDVIEVMRKEGVRILNEYNAVYKDMVATSADVDNKDLSDFSDDMREYLATAKVFKDISRQIGDLVYSEDMEKEAKTDTEKDDVKRRKETLTKLREESDMIFKSMENIQAASQKFADKHIGERNLVFGLLKPERVLKGLGSMFRGVSELPLRSLEILSKLTAIAQSKASADALEKVKKLMDIRARLAKRGGDLRSFVRSVYQKDEENKMVNKLVNKYKDEFRKTVDTKAEEGGDMAWLKSNIDVDAYRKEADKIIKKQHQRIDKTNYPGTEEEVKRRRTAEKIAILDQYDIDSEGFIGYNNWLIKNFPLRKWLSDEYLKIEQDPDLLALYDFIVEFNQEAKDIGYIDGQVMRTFLPFIRKGMAEELVWDNTLSVMQNWKNATQMRADDAGLGAYNELTGELENTIPRYYTYDFTFKDGVNDYSEVSEDLFKNLILYIQQVEKYKYLSEVEGQLKLIKTIEQFKNHLNTNSNNEVVKVNGKPEEIEGNEQNTRMFDDFLRVMLYDQKYVISDVDLPLNIGTVINFVKKSVNKVAGTEVFKPEENPSASSLIKTMDAANRAFQIKTLGLEFISGAVNAFGGNLQTITQAGNYFKAREFLENEGKMMTQSFASEEEKEMFTQLVETFLPLKDDPSYEMMKKAGMSPLTRGSLSDTLMWFMRFPEQIIEKSIFVSLLQNAMVEDGKIVNIREFVKNKYKDRYDSSAKYKQYSGLIDKEMDELKKTKSIWVTKELKDGKLVIPGLDLSNKTELQRLTTLTKNISSNVTGNMTKQTINRMSMNIWTRSMMLFKNWIPKLADTRFGEFRKVADDFSIRVGEEGQVTGQKYDVGRIRLLADVMFRDNIVKGMQNISNILAVNDEGLKLLDEMFEEYREKYERETGEVLNMTREDFIDLIRTNLSNQLKELAIFAALIAAKLSLGLMAPDDDEDKATKNLHRFAIRTMDKFVGELSFFYNPAEFESVLSGGIFPAVGILNDFSRFTKNLYRETTGFDMDPETTPEEVRKKAQPIKYAMKMFPITKSLVTYLAILDSDFAKEYQVTIQKESSMR